ncbi:MAG: hypothetical protein Q3995_03950 [Eubacteriales bacterium]|nr:hypothetical protein [Eubacteriales bacterium]
MEFHFTTVYDRACMTAMAKALRKTVRRKHSRRTNLFGYLLIAFVLFLWLPIFTGRRSADFGDIVSLIVIIVVAVVLWKEDSLNALIAQKRMLPTSKHAEASFTDSGYRNVTDAAVTEWKYENIPLAAICDVGDYVVFLLNKNFAQAYDKRTLTGGSIEDFYRFIEQKTGIHVVKIGG